MIFPASSQRGDAGGWCETIATDTVNCLTVDTRQSTEVGGSVLRPSGELFPVCKHWVGVQAALGGMVEAAGARAEPAEIDGAETGSTATLLRVAKKPCLACLLLCIMYACARCPNNVHGVPCRLPPLLIRLSAAGTAAAVFAAAVGGATPPSNLNALEAGTPPATPPHVSAESAALAERAALLLLRIQAAEDEGNEGEEENLLRETRDAELVRHRLPLIRAR